MASIVSYLIKFLFQEWTKARVLTAVLLDFFRDQDNAIIRPLPRVKRLLSDSTCLPHITQVSNSSKMYLNKWKFDLLYHLPCVNVLSGADTSKNSCNIAQISDQAVVHFIGCCCKFPAFWTVSQKEIFPPLEVLKSHLDMVFVNQV